MGEVTAGIGIGFAFVAMLCWGIGDFLIQRSTRKLGDWETLFLITFFGALVLFPFVYENLPAFFASDSKTISVVLLAAVALFVAALLYLEALRRGKIAVVETILPVEIISAAALAYLVIHETLSPLQVGLIALLFAGLFLVSRRNQASHGNLLWEKGVVMAFLGAVVMGAADFLVGWGTRLTDALLVNFVFNAVIAIGSAWYLIRHRKLGRSFKDLVRLRIYVVPMIILDNVAWIAYAFAMGIAPIGLVTAFSEGAVIVAVILGLAVGRERLQAHQKVGLLMAVLAAISLAALTA